ncbi:hypothetical protein JTE90_011154 [Oedothorax gibbosus]|uniref:Uncharacterized protein n=1 Tax=Oedothorax gibbosus TaxID=931172 RepID=A0AAV6U173_9ARAC|nr:hypothetical protein JTE90_011154 [Oedothorax gibbosus]
MPTTPAGRAGHIYKKGNKRQSEVNSPINFQCHGLGNPRVIEQSLSGQAHAYIHCSIQRIALARNTRPEEQHSCIAPSQSKPQFPYSSGNATAFCGHHVSYSLTAINSHISTTSTEAIKFPFTLLPTTKNESLCHNLQDEL